MQSFACPGWRRTDFSGDGDGADAVAGMVTLENAGVLRRTGRAGAGYGDGPGDS